MSKKTIYILLAVCSIIYVCCLSTTSPMYLNVCSHTDTCVFQAMGWNWLHGAVPYRDLFDHKGPLIFAINALGFLLTGNKYGITIIEICFMFVGVLFCWKLLRTELNDKKSLAATALIYIINITSYFNGNTTEEYCTPFIMASYYYAYTWLKRYDAYGTTDVNVRIPLILGLTLGCCAATRITNALPVCIISIVVAVILVKEKDWHSLLKATGLFAAGAIVIEAPFIIYFYVNGALEEFWFCNWTFNTSYTGTPVYSQYYELKSYIITYAPVWMLTAVAAIALIFGRRQNKNAAAITFLLSSLVTAIFFHAGNRYIWYAQLLTPCLPVLVCIMVSYSKQIYKTVFRTTTLIIAVWGLFAVWQSAQCAFGSALQNRIFFPDMQLEKNFPIYTQYKEIIKHIPQFEKANKVLVDCPSYMYLYPKPIKPACRFFVLQDFQAQYNARFREMRDKAFSDCTARYIVYKNPSNDKNINFRAVAPNQLLNVIQRNYTLVYKTEDLNVYEQK